MNKKIFSLISFFSFLFLSFGAYGQTRCPVGAQAGSAQCLPDDAVYAPPRPTGEWIKTWGALISSNTAQGAWTSKGKFSKDDAINDALGRCQATGAPDCHIDSTYFNQCVAVVGSPDKLGLSISKAKNESIAKNAASADCQQRGGQQCEVKFSDCTEPFFRKF
ncbi:DUF4189 domain-containing protein [Xanthomonas sacchari]|uniref:DUF4189 domain-containing protein n=1 Tax=Xanthomonas sacchari TaxID=56458 RepID=UPI00224FCFE2|nr:DUF4189 domain-containing protein [Xanthomonas sacchari]UYK68185.1 DUF4189 domain-containing protein [Xanthomonas sacchari]UYK86346.1 DUF4189 domain-containing protein [Xanthomonas sacchari]